MDKSNTFSQHVNNNHIEEKGSVPTMKQIFIRKEAGQPKDAFRVTDEASIPDFLRTSVVFDDYRFVHITCVEGKETCAPGAVIAWEQSSATPTGYNCWVVGNASTNLIEKDGKFFKKATVFQAEPLTENFPELVNGAAITRNPDGSWSIQTPWGRSTGFPGKALWVRYGTREDGSPDANILTMSEKSFQEYLVCEQDGTVICPLAEYDLAG